MSATCIFGDTWCGLAPLTHRRTIGTAITLSPGMNTWVLGAAKMLLAVQTTGSAVTGLIRDAETGGPLPGAVVVLADLSRSTVSDSIGRYTFTEVPSGSRPVTVQVLGYAPRLLRALVPAEGRVEINISLTPLPMLLPALVVQSPVPLPGAENDDSTAFPDRRVSVAAIRNDPLLAEPDGFLALGRGEIVSSPESPSGMHVRGAASDQTAYLLDGIPVFSPYHAAGTFSAWNPDALQRLEVSTTSPAGFTDALSGTVAAVTRAPGFLLRTQGGASTTQARLAVDGPLGSSGAGYLVSYRAGFPGVVAPADPTYLGGKTGDLLAKVEGPALGGRLRFLVYDGDNAIHGAAVAGKEMVDLPSNSYQWHSQSIGLQWARPLGGGVIRVQAWTASGDADASWTLPDTSTVTLTADRRDEGVLALIERNSARRATTVGARVVRSRTAYGLAPREGSDSFLHLDARSPQASLLVLHRRPLGPGLKALLGLSGTATPTGSYLNIDTQLRWQSTARLLLSAGVARSHQFSQSLRNPESVVGNIFPADLYIGAGASGIPVARSDRGVLAAEYRPAVGWRFGAQVSLSDYSGLLLVAPRTSEPFATTGFTTGAGTAGGFSLEATLSRPRYGLLASYGWQRVRLQYADSSYTPTYGASHIIEVGATVFPWTGSSIRLGATGVIGRSATAVNGDFEWEACNLLDRGCQFGGSPHGTGPLGGTRLPAYLRLDLSLRREWHLSHSGRDVTVALFGTVTNILGRRNVLTIATNPVTGRRTSIEMRPFAPLVAGIDWRF